MPEYHTRAHFIDADTYKMVAQLYIQHIPRVGEECRFKEGEYWKVVLVVHCFDETVSTFRVNIGVSKIVEERK